MSETQTHTFLCLDCHFGSNQKQVVPLPAPCTTHPTQHMHTVEPSLGSVHSATFAVFLVAYGVTGSGHGTQLTALPWENPPLQTPPPADLPFASSLPQALVELPQSSPPFLVLSNPPPQKLLPWNLYIQTFTLSTTPRILTTDTPIGVQQRM